MPSHDYLDGCADDLKPHILKIINAIIDEKAKNSLLLEIDTV